MKFKNLDTLKSNEEIISQLACDISSYLNELKDKPILFFYSGGSALNVLSFIFGELKKTNFPFKQLTLSAIDERVGEQSNFLEFFERKEYSLFVESGCRVIDTHIEDLDLVEAGDWYNKIVNDLLDIYDKGQIVSLIGMGADGHTAGIFPSENKEEFDKNFMHTDRMVYSYDVGYRSDHRERFSLTVPALECIGKHFAIVMGEAKREALLNAREVGDEYLLPARIWNKLNLKVYSSIKFNN